MRLTAFASCAAMLVLATAGAGTAAAKGDPDSERLRDGVTRAGIMEHQNVFQGIASANGNTRAAATPGYDRSVDYVVERLRAAGYNANRVPFDFPEWTQNQPSQLAQLSPTSKAYAENTDFLTAQFSGSTDGQPLDKQVVPTNDIVIPPGASANTSNSGCEAGDFPAATSGNIALIQRGTCTFVTKIQNAQTAGAVGVLIFNEGQPGRTDPIGISATPYTQVPVLFTSFATGEELYNAAKAGTTTIRVVTDTTTTPREQFNVIADSRKGDPDETVVVGAHLDSVEEGPGINDNGSGSSTILEIAEEIAELKEKPKRRLRFAFWGAEEAGLIGSTAYVNSLPEAERKRILLNLNFDMVGSPNFVRFVYDGDNSDTPPPASGTPAGSDRIESVFNRYFSSQDLETDPTAFDGRSDYGPFIAQGIPAGGLFTGAEGIKTADQATTYGGTAGAPYDPCYHQACDTIANLNPTALAQMSDGAAHATWYFATVNKPFGKSAPSAKRATKGKAAQRMGAYRYKGPFAQR